MLALDRFIRFVPPVILGLTLFPAAACRDVASSALAPRTTSAEPVASMAVRRVPFRATYVITPQLLFPGDPGYPARCPTGPLDAAGPATGAGKATHLGHVMETESACIDFATLSLTLGEFSFTAANGDRVFGTFEGSASFDPPPPSANLFCTWEITGGTGRFAGATGVGECANSRQLGDGHSLIGFDGWITYDASERSNR